MKCARAKRISPGVNSIFVICMGSREEVDGLTDEVWGQSYCRIRILSWESKWRWGRLKRNSLLWREVKYDALYIRLCCGVLIRAKTCIIGHVGCLALQDYT